LTRRILVQHNAKTCLQKRSGASSECDLRMNENPKYNHFAWTLQLVDT
jgi:hypothetical protein